MKSSIHTDHTLIIDELETSIKFHNLDLILGFLPKGSYLVGGYIRDIILGRKTEKVDFDIVVPLNAIEIGKKIADKIGSRFIILDEKREVVRIILNNIYVDIANQVSSTIEGDLCSRDFSINSIAFLFDETNSSLIEVGLRIASFTYGGLLGLFFLSKINLKINPLYPPLGLISSMILVFFLDSWGFAWTWFVLISSLANVLLVLSLQQVENLLTPKS